MFDGKENFDTTIQVSWHQVGAAHEHLILAAISKIIDTGMFEKPADDRGDRDGGADVGDSRSQPADASDLEIDLYAGLRGPVERLNTGPIHQRVQFKSQVSVALFAMEADFPLDSIQKLLPQREGGNQQFAIAFLV